MGSSSVAAFSRDINGKKKRTNRSAKLKQCKLDAKREQWLSQVKSKGGDKKMNKGSSAPLPLPLTDRHDGALDNLEMKSRGDGNEGLILHDSDSESLTNSTGSSIPGNISSRMEHARNGGLSQHDSDSESFTNSHGRSMSSNTSSRTECAHSSSSSGCFSGNVSQDDEEEEEDGCLDDWEAVADALTADDDGCHLSPGSPPKPETTVKSSASPEFSFKACGSGIANQPCKGALPRAAVTSCRAWRPDDAFRPQSLPNISKQHSFPMSTVDKHFGHRADAWGCHSVISQPPSCPICYEDLDLTDSSFLPCSCGFRLCLFCHKRILEADGRCPGCRKQYSPMDGEMRLSGVALPFRLARSCSMSSRA